MTERLTGALAQRTPLTFLNDVLGVSLTTIGEELGVTRSYLSMVKAGQRKLNDRQRKRLHRMLEEALDELDEAPIDEAGVITALIRYGETL